MKKIILVLFIGMVLAINVYGIAIDIIEAMKEAEAESQVATVVYME